MEKEKLDNTTISFKDWKIIMFDHEGVKITKAIWRLFILFPHLKFKDLITQKYKVKGCIMHNYNQIIASQNLFYNLFKWTSNVILSLRFSHVGTWGSFPGAFDTKKSRIAMKALA